MTDDTGGQTMTVRETLDRLMVLSHDYRWAEMGGVAVIRPLSAWTDSTDVLNARVASFNSPNSTITETLATFLHVPAPQPGHLDTTSFAMAFDGGTMLDALNALVRARGGVGWNAGVIYHPTPSGDDPNPTLTIGIRTFNAGDRSPDEGARVMGTPVRRLLAVR